MYILRYIKNKKNEKTILTYKKYKFYFIKIYRMTSFFAPCAERCVSETSSTTIEQKDFMRKLLDASETTHRSIFEKANELDRLMIAYMYVLVHMTQTIHENGQRMTAEERGVEFKRLFDQYETTIENRRVTLCNLIETEVRIPARKTKWLGWIDSQFAFFENKKQEMKNTYIPNA